MEHDNRRPKPDQISNFRLGRDLGTPGHSLRVAVMVPCPSPDSGSIRHLDAEFARAATFCLGMAWQWKYMKKMNVLVSQSPNLWCSTPVARSTCLSYVLCISIWTSRLGELKKNSWCFKQHCNVFPFLDPKLRLELQHADWDGCGIRICKDTGDVWIHFVTRTSSQCSL